MNYIYEKRRFKKVDLLAEQFDLEKATELSEYRTKIKIITILHNIENDDTKKVADIVYTNEADCSNLSEILDYAQMFHVDEKHERIAQKFVIEMNL